MTEWPSAVSNVGYQPFGPVSALTFGNGITESRSFDLDYRLTSLTDNAGSPVQNLTYGYDPADNVLSIADGIPASNTQAFGYDALNHLVSAAGTYGTYSYTYDSVGNRVTESAAEAPAQYIYTPHSNQISSLAAGGAPQTVGHTGAGSINALPSTTLSYNQAGRLATVTAGGNQTRYTYDAFGHRLLRLGALTATTLYQYDLSGHLLEETDGRGNALVDYIYLDDLPAATLSPATAEVYFLQDDRLGVPQLATDAAQHTVWLAGYGPFGEMSNVPAGIVQNLRFPGQEFDIETGLYHNGFRDYVPGWGRYLQSDPIGLAGGINTYSYALANPVNSIDPSGLQSGLGESNVPYPISRITRTVNFGNTPAHFGLYTVGAEGTPNFVFDARVPLAAQALSARELATIIRSDPNYEAGEPVRLDACNTGVTRSDTGPEGPFAQQLADALGATVYAPDGYLIVQGNGEEPLVVKPVDPDFLNVPLTDQQVNDKAMRGEFLPFQPRSIQEILQQQPVYGPGQITRSRILTDTILQH